MCIFINIYMHLSIYLSIYLYIHIYIGSTRDTWLSASDPRIVPALSRFAQACAEYTYEAQYRWGTMCKKRNRSHTQTDDKNNTTDNKNITTDDHAKNHPLHLTTIEGGAATVRTTSHARVGGHTEGSVGGTTDGCLSHNRDYRVNP